ncbi:uncharacterized protein LOC132903445 [Amyelois transitella]|uniref:uncharacterized protein LOC132903445 n=1 Tax=Amyelois transitella TaxID=680683 RepID=UPI00299010CA|nr:uncharacterized protein LOC132903445 [Amyelois transitella]
MPTPEKKVLTNPEQIQEQPVREITQTDHLNKKLLTSLFNRMNEVDSEGGNSLLAKMLEPDNDDFDDDFEDREEKKD